MNSFNNSTGNYNTDLNNFGNTNYINSLNYQPGTFLQGNNLQALPNTQLGGLMNNMFSGASAINPNINNFGMNSSMPNFGNMGLGMNNLGVPDYNILSQLGSMNQNNPNYINQLQQLQQIQQMQQLQQLQMMGMNNQLGMNMMMQQNPNLAFSNFNQFNVNNLNSSQRSMPNMNPNLMSMYGSLGGTGGISIQQQLQEIKEDMMKQKEIESKEKLEDIKREKEETILVKKDFNENIVEKQKKQQESKPDVEVFVPQSEILFLSDRFFFEELIMQPLKIAGCLGNSKVFVDKKDLYEYFYNQKVREQANLLMGKVLTKENKSNILYKIRKNNKSQEKDNYNSENFNSNSNLNKEKNLESQQGLIEKLDKNNTTNKDSDDYFYDSSRDGVYLDIIKKQIFSYNLQKVEQRCIRDKEYDWFKFNGDIRLDTDIFSENMTKPIDISLSKNNKFETHYLSSFLTDRTSSRISKSYKMKIFISKLSLEVHPLFINEDILNSKMKRLYSEFYEKMNAQNISYLIEKNKVIHNQLNYYSKLIEKNKSITNEENALNILLKENEIELSKEKEIIKKLGKQLYSVWLELKQERKIQGFNSTTEKLSVLKFENTGSYIEENMKAKGFNYAFILQYIEPTTDSKYVNSVELARRKKLKETECFFKIFINGVYSSKTDKKFISWPGNEIDFNELIYINVYTRPSKIELELHINNGFDTEIGARFEIEAPGIFMNTITSSSTLVEKIRFNDFDSTNPNINYKNLNKESKGKTGKKSSNEKNQENKNDENQKSNVKLDSKGLNDDEDKEALVSDSSSSNLNDSYSEKFFNNLPEEIEKEKQKRNIKNKHCTGLVIVKCEWADKGSDIPPSKIENKLYIIKQQVDFHKMIQKYNKYNYPFDVNDPRNKYLFAKMKKEKTELMLKYFLKEIELPYTDLDSFRHALLKGRSDRSSLRKLKVPLLEMEIRNNIELKKIIDELKIELPEENEKEFKEKLNKELKNIEDMYYGKELSEDQFKNLVAKKIRLLRRDEANKVHYSYDQIVDEYKQTFNFDCLKKFFGDLFSTAVLPARKLKPKKPKKKQDDKVLTQEISINVHLIKGYNIPVRFDSLPQNMKDELKKTAIDTMFKSGFKESERVFNQLLKRTGLNNSISVGGSLGNYNNPMRGMNVMNNFEQIGTNQNSFIGGGFPGINPNDLGKPQLNNFGIINNNLNNSLNNSLGGYNNNPYQPPNQLQGVQMDQNVGQVSNLIELLSSMTKNIESFVEIKVIYYDQEQEVRTDSLEGVHPDYNHKHSFKIKPKNGEYFTKEEIHSCSGGINFTLFDEIRQEEKIEQKDSNTYIYKYEKKYLGNFFIPFSTIFQNATLLETMSRVKIPLSVTGYYSDTSSIYEMLDKMEQAGKNNELIDLKSEVLKIVNPNIATYMSLYISVDPILGIFKDEENDFTRGFEDPKFLINSNALLKNMMSTPLLSNRYIRVFADNLNGYSVFLCRFIHPQEPPKTIFDKDNNLQDPYSIEKAARYVALIPFLDDCQAFDEMPECWCTDCEFLNLRFGDYEEHAILLCNYFNYIDSHQNKSVRSHLLLGKGHPEGHTSYVVRCNLDNFEYELWNAKTGECCYFDKRFVETKCCFITFGRSYSSFNISDAICQLKEVGCIVTSDNIYVNTQPETNPNNIDFNLLNKDNWSEFLNESAKEKYFPNGIISIQRQFDNLEGNFEEAFLIKEEVYSYIKRQ
jgi:hypothetical protein